MMPRPKPVTSYSKDTKKLLDSMMSSSGLPLAEQRRLRIAVDKGPGVPLPPARRRPAPRNGNQPQQPYEDLLQGVPIRPNMALPGMHRKTQQQILIDHGGSMERDQFAGGGKQPKDRVAMTQQLQYKMEYGKHAPPVGGGVASSSNAPPPPPPPRQRSENDQLRDSIVTEIDERREFLEQQRAMGRTEHDAAIQTQIAERLHDLKRLDALTSGE